MLNVLSVACIAYSVDYVREAFINRSEVAIDFEKWKKKVSKIKVSVINRKLRSISSAHQDSQ